MNRRLYAKLKELEEKPFAHEPYSELTNALKIVLFDTETFDDLESLNVVLLGNHTKGIRYGQEVIVTGSLHAVTLRNKTLPYLFVGLNPIKGVKNPIEHINKKESVVLNEEDKQKIRRFIAQNKGKELETFGKLMVPSIIGGEHVKQGLLMAYINSGKDPILKRRRLNSLLIGDPGLAKSKFLRFMVRLGGGNSTFASAADATVKSLIAVYDPESGVIFTGPVPRAHGGICAIDEVGHVSPEDQGYLLSAMEEGEITWGRWGRNAKLQASDTFVLAANPVGNSGKLKDAVKIHNHEYSLIGQVRDRIDLFFIFRKSDNFNDEMHYAHNNLQLEKIYDKISKEEEENIEFLQKLYIMCQECHPTLSTDAEHMLMVYYARAVIPKNSPFSRRLLESLKNASYALAKIKLKDIVDADTAIEVIEFFKVHISQHLDAIVDIPNDPKVDAAEKVLKKAETSLPGKYDWILLLYEVCKEDSYISGFVGFDKDGQRDWSSKSNRRIRSIREQLTILLPAYKDRILVFSTSPLRIAWKTTYTDEDKDTAINIDSIMCRDGSIRDDVKKEDLSTDALVSIQNLEHSTIRESQSQESKEQITETEEQRHSCHSCHLHLNDRLNETFHEEKTPKMGEEAGSENDRGMTACHSDVTPKKTGIANNMRNKEVSSKNGKRVTHNSATITVIEHENPKNDTNDSIEAQTRQEEESLDESISIDTIVKTYQQNPESWKPVVSVEKFFKDNMPLPGHSLEESPCYPIIDTRFDETSTVIYYCKLHPELGSMFLNGAELHCLKEPDIHKAEILKYPELTNSEQQKEDDGQ